MDASKPDNCPFERYPIPPEVIEEIRANFNEEEILREIEEMRRTGGVTFKQLIAALDEVVASDERAA
jgi:hypothetical protein